MNPEVLEELALDACEQLSRERATPGLSPEAKARVLGKLTSSTQALQTSLAAGAAKGAVGATSKLLVAAVFAGGVVSGSLATVLLRPAPLPLPAIEVQVAEPPDLDAAAAESSAPSEPKVVPAPVKVRPKPAAVVEPSNDAQLEEERALVEMARSAFARRRLEDVAAAITAHRQRFPHGTLAEERDALGLRLTLERGEVARAAEQLTDFEARYPQSMLTPSLRAAVKKATER